MPVAVVAVFYGTLTIVFPPGTFRLFVGITGVCAVVLLVGTELLTRRRLRASLALGSGREDAAGPVQVSAALREVAAFPDWYLQHTVLAWAGGGVGIALALAWLAPGSGLPLRMALNGLCFGALTAVLGYLYLATLSRKLLPRAAEELGVGAVELAALIPQRGAGLGTRISLLTAMLLVVPSMVSADVASTVARNHIAHVVALAAADRPAEAAEVYRAVLLAGGAIGLALIAFALAITYLVAGLVAKPLVEVAARVSALREGRFVPGLVLGENEVWGVITAFMRAQEQLRSGLASLGRAAHGLEGSTEALVLAASGQSTGAHEQAVSLNLTTATTEELARSARQIAHNAEDVARLAATMSASADAGQKKSASFLGSMAQMRTQNHAIADAVVRLNKRVQQIGKVVEFINEVADKSDLLALNAELEGTKAGEVGRGFSLVAAEMRRLAESVLGSTREIGQLIHEIRDATHAAVMATEAGVKATEGGAAVADRVSRSLQAVVGLANQTAGSVRGITQATHQQQTGTDQLSAAMASLLELTRSSQEVGNAQAESSVGLAALSGQLNQVLGRFKVERS